uniref:Uncharacterized protein n=1 Tax=Ananas comosus var. bracteatus TaxID=296719 RepID=A0A6V7QLL4_ANACO|nr:unnamed protein product [Ananas comosus var. bracteatus]
MGNTSYQPQEKLQTSSKPSRVEFDPPRNFNHDAQATNVEMRGRDDAPKPPIPVLCLAEFNPRAGQILFFRDFGAKFSPSLLGMRVIGRNAVNDPPENPKGLRTQINTRTLQFAKVQNALAKSVRQSVEPTRRYRQKNIFGDKCRERGSRFVKSARSGFLSFQYQIKVGCALPK